MDVQAAVGISAPLALAAAVVPGAAWVLAAGPSNRSRAASVGTMLALSPGLYGGAIALLLSCGLQLHVATVVALAGYAIIAGFAAWWYAGRRLLVAAEQSADSRLMWGIAVAVPLLVALFPALSEWWRLYSDAWNHAGITRAIVERGAHPHDPFFAGLPLQYPWIYHAQMASLVTSTGASTFVLMSLWSLFALTSVLLCAVSIGARLHGRSPLWGLVLLLFGLNAAFPLLMPLLLAKAMVGSVHGWPEVVRTFSPVPFGVTRATSFLISLGGTDFFLNKFMVATPFALGLAAYTAFTASLLRWLDGRDGRELWIAAGATLAAGLMHPVVALALVGAMMGLSAGALFAPRVFGLPRRAALAVSAAVAAGAIPVALYTNTILGGAGGSHRELPIDVSLWKFLGLYSTLALGLLLAVRPMLDLVRADGPRRAWVAWIAIHLAIATVIRLPGSSSYFTIDKFSYLVWIPLALTAGGRLPSVLAGRRTGTRLAILLLAFVPVNGFALAGRICDPRASTHQPWDLPGFVWMRANLPPEAVVVVQNGDAGTGMLVSRDQYMSDEGLGRQLGYPVRELASRRELAERLFASDSLNPGEASRLRELGRPVYAVWTRFADPRLAAMRRSFWPPQVEVPLPDRRPHWEGRYPIVYDSGTHVVAELVPARAGATPSPAAGSAAPSR